MIKETRRGLENYQITEELGRGEYGTVVWKAFNKYTGEVVKVLEENFTSDGEILSLSQLKLLEMLNNHPKIINLKEVDVIREDNTVYSIFEYMECSLAKYMLDRTEPFSETDIRDLCFQAFQVLDYIHRNNYVHHHMKPSNLFVSGDLIKIGYLGHDHEIINGDPPYTGHDTTLWYRAPEMFLCAPRFKYAVDMWAMGAIMMELFTNQPLFKGSSSTDVMNKICEVLGSPTETTWLWGLHLANKINYQFPENFGWKISTLVPCASSEAINLIDSLLSWNPDNRPTATEALQHPFFDSCYINLPIDSESVEDSHEYPICSSDYFLYEYDIKEEECQDTSFDPQDYPSYSDYSDYVYVIKEECQETSMKGCTIDSEGAKDVNKITMRLLQNSNGFEIKEETSVKSCKVDSEKADDAKEDVIDRILPEYQNEIEIKKESESILTDRSFRNDSLFARFKIFCKSKINL